MIPEILEVIIRLKPALFIGAGEPAMIRFVCFLCECRDKGDSGEFREGLGQVLDAISERSSSRRRWGRGNVVVMVPDKGKAAQNEPLKLESSVPPYAMNRFWQEPSLKLSFSLRSRYVNIF